MIKVILNKETLYKIYKVCIDYLYERQKQVKKPLIIYGEAGAFLLGKKQQEEILINDAYSSQKLFKGGLDTVIPDTRWNLLSKLPEIDTSEWEKIPNIVGDLHTHCAYNKPLNFSHGIKTVSRVLGTRRKIGDILAYGNRISYLFHHVIDVKIKGHYDLFHEIDSLLSEGGWLWGLLNSKYIVDAFFQAFPNDTRLDLSQKIKFSDGKMNEKESNLLISNTPSKKKIINEFRDAFNRIIEPTENIIKILRAKTKIKNPDIFSSNRYSYHGLEEVAVILTD